MQAHDIAGVDAPDRPLDYPFDTQPEPGTVQKVAEGIYWTRMPLPFEALGYINLWLIEDGDGWTIVDTGIREPKTQGWWDEILDGFAGGKPIKKVIVTHYHPDHVGCAGWLCKSRDSQLWMSRTEYQICRMYMGGPAEGAEEYAQEWMRSVGYPDEAIAASMNRSSGGFNAMVSNLPVHFKRLVDGAHFKIGDRTWQIKVGRGHAPEHACLYCPSLGVLISGDQVLPRISSNVSVQMGEPESDPLSEWLDSCRSFQKAFPADTLVLPAHNEPFYGLHSRLQALIDGHEDGLDKLIELCRTPQTPEQTFKVLFKRKVGPDMFNLAVGEAVAHLNCLIERGLMTRFMGDDGIWRFETESHA